jgi:hypothetical protein
MVEECRFGINDLSAVALDTNTNLPRFNMPLALGLFLGCRRFGPQNQSKKRTLIRDSEQYRYRQFISDISGQDIRHMEAIPRTPFGKYETGSRQHLGDPGYPEAAKLSIGIADSGPTCLIFARPLDSNRTGLPSLIYPRPLQTG